MRGAPFIPRATEFSDYKYGAGPGSAWHQPRYMYIRKKKRKKEKQEGRKKEKREEGRKQREQLAPDPATLFHNLQ